MRKRDEELFNTALEALRASGPNAAQLSASSARVADRLSLNSVASDAFEDERESGSIKDCGDVQKLLPSYRAGTLSAARSVLIEAHLRDCGPCLLQSKRGLGSAVDWSAPKAQRSTPLRPQRLGWALRWAAAPALAIFVASFFIYKAYWQIPPGVRAEVQTIDGSAYAISEAGDRRLSPGDKLAEGEHLRTSGGAHALLKLSDGSAVEVNERSILGVGARGHNMTVSLDRGAVIVEASKRTAGHLYIKTPDCRVAVTGTVFSVDSGIKGSRVAVLRGSVQVMHAGLDTTVHAGDQLTTSENLSPAPLEQQVAWSHDREKYQSLVAQLALLEHRIGQIPFPQPRYSSDLLERVPVDTLLYVSIPNLGDFLSEANKIFHDQLQQSPALQQWWSSGPGRNTADHNTADLDSMVEKLHQMSQYLGSEVVIVGVKEADNPGLAIIADLQQSGLEEFLKKQFPLAQSPSGLTVLDEKALEAIPAVSKGQSGGYALIRPHEAVFSNNIATLKQIDAQLNAGSSGFAASEFGQQIAAAYTRGAGVVLAADLHQMMAGKLTGLHVGGNGKAIENSGIDGVRYLIAEHRELNGIPQNHLNLQFAGTRQRVASWLAAPAPIGSLDFVTPNASVAMAALSKDPAEIADDIIAMTAPKDGNENNGLNEAQEKLQIDFRNDLAANLGGDFLLSLDGPVLPTPSWKAVIEVHDSARLENTLERLTQSINQLARGEKAHSITIESAQVGAQSFYSLREQPSGNVVAQYTFADGYMIIAPDRALLMEALRTHASGDSLARSTAFKTLLPKDDNENYSAVAYQNLSPVLTPLLSQMSGERAQALQQLAADARPTAICAWGKDTRIEAAGDSHLFGFDFLTLGALIGNKHGNANVRELHGYR